MGWAVTISTTSHDQTDMNQTNHGCGLWLLCVTGPNDVDDDVVNGVVNRLCYLVQPIPLRWSSSA